MVAKILDVTGWSLEFLDGYWSYVDHATRHATSGYGTRPAAIKNANGYRDDA